VQEQIPLAGKKSGLNDDPTRSCPGGTGREGLETETSRPQELRNEAPQPKKRRRRKWWRIITETALAMITDRGSMAAAGCAFYATLALFPAITMLVSIYGLVFDKEAVEQQLRLLHPILPPPAFVLVANRVDELVAQPPGQLGLRLIIGTAVTFYSAVTGTKSLLSALNVAYDVTEQRSYLLFQLLTMGITFGAMMVVVLGIALLVFVPVVINFIGLQAEAGQLIHAAGLLFLLFVASGSFYLLYRIGPSRHREADQRIMPGVVTATCLWLAASAGLNYYVANLSNLGATYGSIAAVVGIMLWFYLSAYSVLVGAELNARLEEDAST
jgi:membrane protein